MRRLLVLLLLVVACSARGDEFLDPELAFRPSLQALDGHTLGLRVEVAEGYYVYRDKFRFAVAEGGATLGEAAFPAGEFRDDPYFGREEVYSGELDVRLPVRRASPEPAELVLELRLQGCAAKGFCYPPQLHRLAVQLPRADAVAAPAPPAAPAAAGEIDETGRIAGILGDAGLLASLAFFFVAGLGLALTPCVLPMVPILSGIIVGQGAKVSRGRGLALSAAYVAGMAFTYAAAGVAAGLGGTLVSAALQDPWVLGGFAALFVVLALSMFGFYELQVPAAIQTRLAGSAGAIRGGTLGGVCLMGAVSALILGPCVAAPLAGALLYIGQTGDALLGGAALFAMALGMGVPLLLVGASAGSLLPRAGAWMDTVKRVFGVMLLATAVYLVSPVLQPAVTMFAWALLLIVPAIYLRALDPLPTGSGGWSRLWKGCGIVMLLAGSTVLVGALGGSQDPLRPLDFLGRGSGSDARAAAPAFERVDTLAELERVLVSSAMPVMLDVYADWCAACKEMERRTFSDPAVIARLGGFRLLQADVTGNDEADRELLRRLGLYGPPGVAFFAPGGQEMARYRVVGFKPPGEFLALIAGIP